MFAGLCALLFCGRGLSPRRLRRHPPPGGGLNLASLLEGGGAKRRREFTRCLFFQRPAACQQLLDFRDDALLLGERGKGDEEIF